ncbi:hypothetical protein [Desulfonema magnum]|uniref:hypothetical protein n=1 Tax=Desulfonema magnum TaxID=45655 RepID=UPI001A9AC8B7|nr:hypothetical protein [Desulfonema magnum]
MTQRTFVNLRAFVSSWQKKLATKARRHKVTQRTFVNLRAFVAKRTATYDYSYSLFFKHALRGNDIMKVICLSPRVSLLVVTGRSWPFIKMCKLLNEG